MHASLLFCAKPCGAAPTQHRVTRVEIPGWKNSRESRPVPAELKTLGRCVGPGGSTGDLLSVADWLLVFSKEDEEKSGVQYIFLFSLSFQLT